MDRKPEARMAIHHRLVIMKAWVQLNAPVWAPYKQKQREAIIRCRRLQGRVPVSQLQRDSPSHWGSPEEACPRPTGARFPSFLT